MNVPRLRFKEFSGGWEIKKLNELTSYVDYRGKTPEKSDEGVFLVTAKNIRFGFIDYQASKEYIPLENYEEVMRRGNPLIGDVLITTEAPLGNVASIDREDIALAQRVIKLRGKEGLMQNSFLKFYLLSERFQKNLFEKASGGTVKGIKGSVLHRMALQFPIVPEQTKIANFLTAVDEKIAQLTQKADLLARYKKGVMQQIFSQQLRFKDDDGREFSEWQSVSLGNLSEYLQSGKSKDRKESGDFVLYGSTGSIGFCNQSDYDGENILIARVGANAGYLYKVDGKYCVSDNTLILHLKKPNNHSFLFYLLKNANLNKLVFGSGQPLITGGQLKALDIFIPLPSEQTKIANFLTALDDKISHNQTQLNALKQYKQGLLQQLFV